MQLDILWAVRMEIKRFYYKYRNYILFNKNIIISGIFAFFGGALFTQLYTQYDSNNFTNSLVTLSIEYGIYIPLFALLFYLNNRQNYLDVSTGKKDYAKIKSDIKKLIAAFSISELIFSVAKITIHFELLQSKLTEPYQASMIGSLVAWAIFLVSINLSVRAAKLFRAK
ncbi:MAG: hypothetical protein H0X03_08490 [Nitrosopumilus sp.]|nr:hypothetical protein [Nitrosopumilus sp.]